MQNAVRKNTLQFDANIPYELVLKYQTGRQCANGRVMFSTMTDENFFLEVDDARKIHELGLAPNEPFKLMRRVIGSGKKAETAYIVSRVGGSQKQQPGKAFENSTPAAVTTTETISSTQSLPNGSKNGSIYSNVLASSYIAAIDALIIAKDYADHKGLTFRITEEEIRCSANSIFIEFGRAKERAAKYGYTQAQNVNGGAKWQQQ